MPLINLSPFAVAKHIMTCIYEYEYYTIIVIFGYYVYVKRFTMPDQLLVELKSATVNPTSIIYIGYITVG